MSTQDYAVNPYNFQVPVSEPKAFAGRKSQREEIEYYLDQASKTRPTNIAIVGPRAAGKTSLLNMIERDATERGIVAVRINFDEGHARSQLRFFFKIFDALVSAVLKQKRALDDKKCFGGRGGRFFELYVQCISNFERVSAEELELVFPNLYAAAMKASNEDRVVVPQSFFESDLQCIAREAGRPIALIMDECNVLIQNREILQAMRGMFQNLDRYMLVMTGTNDMFPVIDDIYSPVGRGFKRISLEGFVSPEETFACMERPCLAHGVGSEVLEQFRPEKSASGSVEIPAQLDDLHKFTAGNPHEIQLACHFMFRDLQERVRGSSPIPTVDIRLRGLLDSHELRLDSSVIAKVLRELAPDEERREILGRVQALDDSALQALGLLTRVGFGFSRDTYRGFVESERAMKASNRTAGSMKVEPLTIAAFEGGLNSLLTNGWLSETEGETGFGWNASQLEEVLLKYVARSKHVFVGRFGSRSLLEPYLARLIGAPSVPVEFGPWLTPWTTSVAERETPGQTMALPHRLRGRAIHALHDRLEIIEVACGTPERDWRVRSVLLPSEMIARGQQWLDWLERALGSAEVAASGYGVRWAVVRSAATAEPAWGSEPSDWTDPLDEPAFLGWSAWMGRYHQRLCAAFLDRKPASQLIRRILPKVSAIDRRYTSDFCFIALAYGLPETRETLIRVVKDLEDSALARYNLALAALFDAAGGLSSAVAELKKIEYPERRVGFRAMLLPKWRAGEIRFEEWRPDSEDTLSPSLKWFVDSAIKELEAALASGATISVVPARQSE